MSVNYDCSVLWQAGMETAIVLLGRHLENAINHNLVLLLFCLCWFILKKRYVKLNINDFTEETNQILSWTSYFLQKYHFSIFQQYFLHIFRRLCYYLWSSLYHLTSCHISIFFLITSSFCSAIRICKNLQVPPEHSLSARTAARFHRVDKELTAHTFHWCGLSLIPGSFTMLRGSLIFVTQKTPL